MKMDIILSKWCLAILFAFGILACTDGGDANELPKEPEGTGETQDEKIPAFPRAEGHGRYTTGGRVAMYILLLHWRTSYRTELYVMVLRN